MTTNELKKGDRVQLANGWVADMMDNKKGNIRLAKVYGLYTEIGSVYAHDIVSYQKPAPNEDGMVLVPIEHTASQLQLRKTVEVFGF
jgi:hypothetical protein